MPTIVTYTDLITKAGRRFHTVKAGREAMVAAAEVWYNDGWLAHEAAKTLTVAVNGSPAAPGYVLKDGDQVIVAPRLGDPVSIVLIAIAVASAIASAVLIGSLKGPAADSGNTPENQRFGFQKFSNDAIAGGIKPVPMGLIGKYGGQIVSKVPIENQTGDGDDRLKMLICFAQDQIQEICGQTGDFDAVDAATLTGLMLNDQSITGFPGCRAWGRMGTGGQAIIPGFEDIEVLREVGVGGAALVNTSGSDYTGSGASGEAFTFTTLNEVNAVRVRVRLPQGLYQTTTSTQLEPATVKWRLRTRASDTGSGAGAWSGWMVVTVTRAEQSEFISGYRVEFAGTPVKRDIQCERVSKDAPSVTIADKLVWDTVVEIEDAANTYAGHAVLALELLAGEQLTGIPRVSAAVKGILPRVWDGVSDESEPVFNREWSRNPAWLALELLTNRTWGLGAQYSDADVDMASLFEWAAYCDETIPATGGGTIARCTFDMVLEEARSGVDWLRTICQAGDCTPVTSGNVWRFIIDRAQATPVEVFTDGDIEVSESGDDAGEENLEVGYALTTGGTHVENQLIAQFVDETANDETNVIVFPEPGTLWLGSPLNEPVKSSTLKLEGIRHPDRIHRQIVRQIKRKRFVGRDVKFTTTRPLVVVQPGDRFDLASSMPGWGLASGRLGGPNTTLSVRLDRSVTLEAATEYTVRVTHMDGSIEDRVVASPAGDYAAGDAIAVTTAFAQAPAEFASYAIGEPEIVTKPFVCTAVRPSENKGLRWEISGFEYAADVYDPEALTVRTPNYTTLDPARPPGPLLTLSAYERLDGNGNPQAELAWTQSPADRQHTASFRIYRRTIGTQTWVLFPVPSISQRGAVFEISQVDSAYEFVVVAVSLGGASLSPYNALNPVASLVLGLLSDAPGPPDGLTLTAGPGNVYTLAWNPVDGASGYQVLTGGDTTSLPNAGAEDCLVLARTVDPELGGLVLAAGRSVTFWVRSATSTGRLSATASSITLATPLAPTSQAVKQTKVFDLSSDGTLSNLTWNATTARLELVSAGSDGVWTSGEIDPGTLTLTQLAFRPGTANDADDPVINTDPFTIPSIAADQWGIVSGSPFVVGMLMPPWPDSVQTWLFEVRTNDGTSWSSWGAVPACGTLRRTFQKWQIRATLRRAAAPYKPALRTLAVVLTD